MWSIYTLYQHHRLGAHKHIVVVVIVVRALTHCRSQHNIIHSYCVCIWVLGGWESVCVCRLCRGRHNMVIVCVYVGVVVVGMWLRCCFLAYRKEDARGIADDGRVKGEVSPMMSSSWGGEGLGVSTHSIWIGWSITKRLLCKNIINTLFAIFSQLESL